MRIIILPIFIRFDEGMDEYQIILIDIDYPIHPMFIIGLVDKVIRRGDL
jgi:hypothetical protein